MRARVTPVAAVAALAAAAVAGAVLPSVAGAAATRTPAARAAATSCKLTLAQEEHAGPSYLDSVSVSGGPSCSAGVALATAYYRCRLANGGVKGHCSKPVLGYRCTEGPRMAIPTEYIATVTCTKGAAHVLQRYTQYT